MTIPRKHSALNTEGSGSISCGREGSGRRYSLLNIGNVYPHFHEYADWPGRHQVAVKLSKKGVRVYVLCFLFRGVRVSDKPVLRNLTKPAFVQYDPDNPNLIWIIPPALTLPLSFVNEWIITFLSIITLLAMWITRKIKFDAIYLHGMTRYHGLIGGSIKLLTRRRMIADHGDPRPDEFYSGLKGLMFRMMEKFSYSMKPDVVHAADPILAKQIISRHGRRVFFFPVCYDLKLLSKADSRAVEELRAKLRLQGKTVILYAGKVDLQHYRVDLLAEAVEKLVKDIADIRIIVAGLGVGLKALQQMVSDKGLNDFFIFLGKVPHDQMPILREVSDINVQITSLYNTGTKVSEAMASGKPIVSAGRWHDKYESFLINGYNCILTPLTAEDLKQGLLKLIRDPDLRSSIASHAFETIRDYNSDTELKVIERWLFKENVGCY